MQDSANPLSEDVAIIDVVVDEPTADHPLTVADDVAEDVEEVAEQLEDEIDEIIDDVVHSEFVLREIIERQVILGQSLTNDLVEAATDVSEALVHTPAVVVAAIRGGATLPAALGQTRSTVQEAVLDAGDRVRTALGGYVERQATLPNALISSAAGVASTVIRAQGTVGGSAANAVFAVAAVASSGGNVRDALGRELREVNASTIAAREDIGESVKLARREIAAAVTPFDNDADDEPASGGF